MWWIIDGNNVYGSRPDGWWNDRAGAGRRLSQAIAEWCRDLSDQVTVVFDAPLDQRVAELAGGNLHVVESTRRGRDGADHHIVAMVDELYAEHQLTIVTSDKGLRARLPPGVTILGVGEFRSRINY